MTPSAFDAGLASGKLYEGNHEEWCPSMNRILEREGVLHASNDWQAATAADLIAEHVQPSFLHRAVSFADRCDSRRMLRRLEESSGQFRFLDLPPELRNRVYDLLLPKDTLRGMRFRRPFITQASHQLREESLPIYFSSSRFRIRFVTQKKDVQARIATVRKWAEVIGPRGLADLRTIELQLDVYNQEAPLRTSFSENSTDCKEIFEITWSREDGLRIKYPDDLQPASKLAIDEHAKRVEANQKALGLKGGGAVMMAVITDVEIWSMKMCVYRE